MKSWKVMYSNAAESDLTDIYAYIAYSLLAPENAVGQAERIMQAVERLSTMPMRHEVYPEEPWKSMGLRYMNVDHYCIFYFPDEQKGEVEIVRIMYSGRDKTAALRRAYVFLRLQHVRQVGHAVQRQTGLGGLRLRAGHRRDHRQPAAARV